MQHASKKRGNYDDYYDFSHDSEVTIVVDDLFLFFSISIYSVVPVDNQSVRNHHQW